MIKTMYTPIDNVTWVQIEIENDLGEYCMEQNTKQTQSPGDSIQVWASLVGPCLFIFVIPPRN